MEKAIETNRLIITKFTHDMAEAVHQNSLDEDTRRFLPEEVFENRNFKKLRISYKLAVKSGEEIVCKYANVEGRHICCIYGKSGDLRTQIEFD